MEGPLAEFDRRADLVLRNLPNPNPMFGMALRPRLGDVDEALARARAWFAARGKARYSWWVSDASHPGDLVGQLLARGLAPDHEDPLAVGMVLEHEPEGEPGIEVRKVASFDEALAAMKGCGVYRALVRARWDEAVRRGTPALVVQAGKMSRPILERLQFERRTEVHILIDEAA